MSQHINHDVKRKLWGLSYVLLYGISTAASSVLIAKTMQSFKPLYAAFYAFLISTIFFNLLLIRSFKPHWKLVKQQSNLVVYINITSALVWIGTFYSLKILPPYIVVAILFGFIPISTTLLLMHTYKNKRMFTIDIIFSLAIAFLLFFIIYGDLFVQNIKLSLLIFSASCAAVSGFFGAVNNIVAKKMSIVGFSAQAVMAVRFYLLITFALLGMLFSHSSLNITLASSIDVVAIALISVALPLFFLQKGIEKISPVYVSYIIALVPAISFAFTFTVPGYRFSWWELIFVSILSFIILLSMIYKTRSHGD